MKAKFDIDNLILAAKKKAEKCRSEWHDAKLELVQMIADCNKTKTAPPNNHWVKEHHLQGKYIFAKQLLASLQEIKEEEMK